MTETQKRIYDLTHQPRNGWDIAGEIADEIDGWRGKLESARADIEEAKDERDALTAERDTGAEQFRAVIAERVSLRDQLAEARAQIAALQGKAEARDAFMAHRRAEREGTEQEEAEALTALRAAYARAREAAKG